MAAMRPARPAPRQASAPPESAPPPAPPTAGNRSLTVPALVVAAAVIAAAFLMKGGGGSDDTTHAVATPTTEQPAEGEVVSLDPITMNLAGGDILKVGIALQLAAGVEEAEHAEESPAAFGARALDETILVLGGYTKAELLAPGGIGEAKAALSARIAGIYHDAVLGVYFTELVIA